MKKYLVLLTVLVAFAIPTAVLAHDSSDDHDNGYGNDGGSATASNDEGSATHVGEEAE